MKKIKQITAVLLIALMLVPVLSGCSGNGYALKIGDVKISESQYRAAAISIKTQFMTDNNLEDTADLWTKPVTTGDSTTMQEYLDAMIQSYLIEYNLYAIHFDQLGLTLTDEDKAKIQSDIDSVIQLAGSRDKLIETLDKQGLSYDEYERNYYNEAKKDKVILYYFGPDSDKNPTSREDIKTYYNEYYTKVKHVFLSTKDSDSNDFTKPEKEEVKKRAEAILKRAQGGEDFDKLIESEGEDPGMVTNPDGYVFSTEDTTYNRIFYNAAFDMQFNEIRLVQTNIGFHVMKRYPFFESEVTDPETELTLIENMKSSEVAELLERLKKEIGVEYNNKMLVNLSVPNIKMQEQQTEAQTQSN